MAAVEEADVQDQSSTLLNTVLDPPFVESFRGSMESGDVLLQIYDRATRSFREHRLRGIFPFMTLADLKLAIYNTMEQDDKALPDFTFVGKPIPPGKRAATTDFAWSIPATPTDPVSLLPPLDLMRAEMAADARFVETSGDRRILGLTDRERMTLESLYLAAGQTRLPTFQVFFYRDLVDSSSLPRPLSELDWNGRLYPYFPRLSVGRDQPTTEQRAKAKRFARGTMWRRQFFGRLEDILNAAEPLIPLRLTGVKYLRLTYPRPKTIPGIEALFYDMTVTGRRPYLRLMPVEGNPISKVHLRPDGRPNLEDPRLLIQWSQEHNPTPDRDYAMAKILYRTASGSIPPLYLTLRLLDDGTADLTVEPQKGVRRLDPRSELNELDRVIREGIQGLPYQRELPRLGTGMFIFGLSVKGVREEAFTTASLRARLGLFKAVFQEIPALPGERPLLMMRYKLVPNFATEDRIQSFITQVMNRRMSRGEALLADLVDMVADEFQLPVAEARKAVAARLEVSSEIVLADAESKEYLLHSNAGVDVAIFGQHPLYSFHLYRVDSVATLQRCITFLSLLFSKSEGELRVPEEAIAEVEEGPSAEVAPAAAAAPEGNGFENIPEEAAAAPAAAEEGNGFENIPEEGAAAPEENGFENIPNATAPEAAPVDAGIPGLDGADLDDFLALANLEDLEGPAAEPGALPEAAASAVEPAMDSVAAAPEPEPELPADAEAVAEDAGGLPPASKVKKFAFKKAAAAPAAEVAEEEPATKKKKGFEAYFSDKLKEADQRLFDYHKSHPSLKKYVSQCGSNLMRQPAVLSQEQYERMTDEYDDVIGTGEVTFYVFPLDKDKGKEPYAPKAGAEYYTLMKYGSAEASQNYYLCCKYWCTRDEILVREVELNGSRLRRPIPQADGTMRTKKSPGTCPFCEGRVIKDRRFPGVNEVVLERIVKPGTASSRHLFINFLRKSNHPDGLELPCCFLEDQPIRIGMKGFPDVTPAVLAARAAAPGTVAEAALEEGELTEEATEEEAAVGDLVSYEEVLLKTKFAYIVGAEKFPLEGPERKFAKVREGSEEPRGPPKVIPPQIGLLPLALNSYFGQDPTQLVSRTFNPQRIRPDAQGFLRIGVENRSRFRADSFLAAVAPFFGKNSISALKQFLTDIIQPRVFMAMNYGNFLLEMFYVKGGRPSPADKERFEEFVRAIGVQKRTAENEELLIRAFMAYKTFKGWLDSDMTTKEYRHFAHLFAQPGILATGVRRVTEAGVATTEYRRPGILFIVLDTLKSGEVRVRCPPYPVHKDAFSRCDIGFLSHHWSGTWEPLFYVDNRSLSERELNTYMLNFSQTQFSRWPKLIQQRIQEFSSQCAAATGGRGVFTSQAAVPATRIVPITGARRVLATEDRLTLSGLVRDSYNHVGALVYSAADATGAPLGLVAVPVVDDGIAMVDLETRVIMDWDDFEPAPIGVVVAFYREFITMPRFPKTYTPVRAVRSSGTGQIVAIQLLNDLYVPVAPIGDVPPEVVLPEEEGVVDEMEWSINRRIAMGPLEDETPLGDETRLRSKEFNEVYEHLRLMFSNWLATEEDGGELRETLEATIFRRDLPLFEKRKRLEIMLAAEIESWLAESDEDAPRQSSLLRVDCRLRDQDECSGMCEWRGAARPGGAGAPEAPGRCLLHVPKTAPTTASGAQVLLARLIEELLRFGEKRKQIFEQRVSQLALIERPIRVGDQYILPEKSAAWTQLLRAEWAKDTREQPQFLEEMTQAPSGPEALAALEEATALPERLQTLLGKDDPKTGRLRLYPSPTGVFRPFLGLFSARPEDIGMEATAMELTDEQITGLVKRAKVPVIQIDLRGAEAVITAKRLATDRPAPGYPVFVLQEDAPPALLVVDPEAPGALRQDDLPVALAKEFQEAKKIFGVRLTA